MAFILTAQVFNIADLSTGPRLVLAVLADFANAVGRSWPSVQTIANHCGMSCRSVQRHLATLKNLGFLQRFYRQGRSSITRISDFTHLLIKPTLVVPDFLPEELSPTYANLSPPPTPNWHREPAIDPVKEVTAVVATEAPAAVDAAPVLQFEKSPEPPVVKVSVRVAEAVEIPDLLIEVAPSLMADFGVVRKNKKKAARMTNTEAVVFADEAKKAGLTVAEAVRTCILRGWSRLEAAWLPLAPTDAVVAAPALYVHPVSVSATQGVVAAGKASLAALRAKPAPQAGNPATHWASVAVEKHRAGQYVSSSALRSACDVLRLDYKSVIGR